jgi:hypothetical protein
MTGLGFAGALGGFFKSAAGMAELSFEEGKVDGLEC